MHTASREEWQRNYDTPSEPSHYYSIVKRGLHGGQYPNLLKPFINSVPFHNFSKPFQLCTGHGVLGKYFQKRATKERSHNCECGQLETVEHVLNEYPLHPAKREVLSKVSQNLISRFFLIPRRALVR